MKNFIQAGSNVTVPAPAAVASGAGVLVGSLFGIANGSAATAADVVLTTTGIFEMTKAATDSMTVGGPVYWDNTAKVATVTASGNTKIGVAMSVAGNPSNTVRVRLNGAF